MQGRSGNTTEYDPVPTDRSVAIEPLFMEIWSVRDFVQFNEYGYRVVSILEVGDEVWLKKDTQGNSNRWWDNKSRFV